MVLQVFRWDLQKVNLLRPTTYSSPTNKNILTKDVIFLQKSFRDYSKVEKPVLVTVSYKVSDDEDKLDKAPVMDQNTDDIGAVIDSKCDNKGEDTFLMKILMSMSKQAPRSLSMQKLHKL